MPSRARASAGRLVMPAKKPGSALPAATIPSMSPRSPNTGTCATREPFTSPTHACPEVTVLSPSGSGFPRWEGSGEASTVRSGPATVTKSAPDRLRALSAKIDNGSRFTGSARLTRTPGVAATLSATDNNARPSSSVKLCFDWITEYTVTQPSSANTSDRCHPRSCLAKEPLLPTRSL